MNKRLIAPLLSYLICFLLAAGGCIAIAAGRGVFTLTDKQEIYKILCDAFFVPGVVFLAIGALILVSNGGFFDGIAYGVKTAFCALVPGLKLKKGESYADFKARKQENRKPAAVKAPFIIGCAFAVASVVFLVLYYSVA